MSSTVGYLVIGMWHRYQRQLNSGAQPVAPLLKEQEAAIIEMIADNAEWVNDRVMDAVNWDLLPEEFDFDAAHLDLAGQRDDSLDAAVWNAISQFSNIRTATDAWLKIHMGGVLRDE